MNNRRILSYFKPLFKLCDQIQNLPHGKPRTALSLWPAWSQNSDDEKHLVAPKSDVIC